MSQSFTFWLLALVVLSAAPGWYLSDLNQKHKASLRAGIEMQQQQARVDYEQRRKAVEDARTAAQGSKIPHIDLKSGKSLEQATLTNFSDEGITFATAGGGAHVPWVELPDDWVIKYRQPLPPVLVNLPEDLSDTDELASLERNRIERERSQIAMQQRRDQIASARAAALGKASASIKLRGRPELTNATVKIFHDDGITFTTSTGLLRIPWSDLPDDWVMRYRDPVAAAQAATVKLQEAAALAETERFGRDVDVVFVREVSNHGVTNAPAGSVVKVISEMRKTRVDVPNQYLFVQNLARTGFQQQNLARMRLYPTGRIFLTNPAALTNPSAVNPFPMEPPQIPVYAGNPAQALQISRELGIKLADLPKERW